MRRRFERNGRIERNGHHEEPAQPDPRELIAGLTSIPPIDGFDGERWYPVVDETREATRGQIANCLSVTTTISAYPLSPYLIEWFKKQGANADVIRNDAAVVGKQVDRGTQLLDEGRTLRREEYKSEVYKAILSYRNYREQAKPEILAQQKTVANIADLVAGTFDKLAEIDGELHLLEVKKTSAIRRTHIIQAQVYTHLLNLMGIPVRYSDVLRLGTKHKAGYELHSEPYDPSVYEGPFMACKLLWLDSHGGRNGPLPREELPESISLDPPKEPAQRGGWQRRRR